MGRSALCPLDFLTDVETMQVGDQVLDQCQIGTDASILLQTGSTTAGPNDANGDAGKKSSDSVDASRVIVDQQYRVFHLTLVGFPDDRRRYLS